MNLALNPFDSVIIEGVVRCSHLLMDGPKESTFRRNNRPFSYRNRKHRPTLEEMGDSMGDLKAEDNAHKCRNEDIGYTLIGLEKVESYDTTHKRTVLNKQESTHGCEAPYSCAFHVYHSTVSTELLQSSSGLILSSIGTPQTLQIMRITPFCTFAIFSAL